ncbi:MAG: phage holin family protein [Marinobacterium sp.]|nr:phage holin family protein [Marinobacterium sp.]
MPDISTTAVKVGASAFGLSLATIAPDGNALIGAFAGATLFVVSAQEYRPLERLIYMLISLVMGYMAAPEITTHTPIKETAVAGFLAGVSCVYAGLKLQEQIRTLNLNKLLKRIKP